MEHYYNNYRKQQKERERIMQRGCLIFAVLIAMMLTAWLVWQAVCWWKRGQKPPQKAWRDRF